MGEMSTRPYAIGERPTRHNIPLIPLLSGRDAWNSLASVRPRNLTDAPDDMKQQAEKFAAEHPLVAGFLRACGEAGLNDYQIDRWIEKASQVDPAVAAAFQKVAVTPPTGMPAGVPKPPAGPPGAGGVGLSAPKPPAAPPIMAPAKQAPLPSPPPPPEAAPPAAATERSLGFFESANRLGGRVAGAFTGIGNTGAGAAFGLADHVNKHTGLINKFTGDEDWGNHGLRRLSDQYYRRGQAGFRDIYDPMHPDVGPGHVATDTAAETQRLRDIGDHSMAGWQGATQGAVDETAGAIPSFLGGNAAIKGLGAAYGTGKVLARRGATKLLPAAVTNTAAAAPAAGRQIVNTVANRAGQAAGPRLTNMAAQAGGRVQATAGAVGPHAAGAMTAGGLSQSAVNRYEQESAPDPKIPAGMSPEEYQQQLNAFSSFGGPSPVEQLMGPQNESAATPEEQLDAFSQFGGPTPLEEMRQPEGPAEPPSDAARLDAFSSFGETDPMKALGTGDPIADSLMPAAKATAAAGEETPSPEAAAKLQESGLSGAGLMKAWGEMQPEHKFLMTLGLSLGTIGLLSSLAGGGSLGWLATLMGFGGAAGALAHGGMLGDTAKGLTHGAVDYLFGKSDATSAPPPATTEPPAANAASDGKIPAAVSPIDPHQADPRIAAMGKDPRISKLVAPYATDSYKRLGDFNTGGYDKTPGVFDSASDVKRVLANFSTGEFPAAKMQQLTTMLTPEQKTELVTRLNGPDGAKMPDGPKTQLLTWLK